MPSVHQLLPALAVSATWPKVRCGSVDLGLYYLVKYGEYVLSNQYNGMGAFFHDSYEIHH
jgi:hypothetical protein